MPTVGVVIPVPEPHGSLLQQRRTAFGDPLGATVPSHITLLPPAEVAPSVLADARDALAGLADATARFDVSLRGTGTFRPVSPVVFVAVSRGISETELLAEGVRTCLGAPEPAFPFHPHVTVAQHLDDAGLDRAYEDLSDFTCDFGVHEIALYLHDERSGWVPEDRFALSLR